MVAIGDLVDSTAWRGLATEKTLRIRGRAHLGTQGQVHLPPRWRGASTSMRSWLKRASSRLSSQKSTARCDCYAPPLLERPPHAANVCAS
jgi:hypothetical protein